MTKLINYQLFHLLNPRNTQFVSYIHITYVYIYILYIYLYMHAVNLLDNRHYLLKNYVAARDNNGKII